MKKNNYNLEKIINKIEENGNSDFILINNLNYFKNYQVYYPYKDCTKVIIYKKKTPKISLIKINNSNNLRHQDILGTIFSLGISEDKFGDIIKYKENYYIFIMPTFTSYLKENLTNIKNEYIYIEEVNITLASNFKQEYLKKEIITSSLRIDNIVSIITKESRNKVLKRFLNNEIILNYEDNIKANKILKEGDIFSIKKYGKYKFSKIIKNTKKNGYIIEILEYK